MKNLCCEDGRAHGCFQFLGASRTGRWAGRHIQYQNLPRNQMPDLDQARELVRTGNFEALNLLYDNITMVLSELIRTASIPPKGMKYIVADFSAIEARVLSFMAGEHWRTEVFKNNGDIYCATASKLFNVEVTKHNEHADKRKYGKITELALGYNGSVKALIAMGAFDMGIAEEELEPLVKGWRAANPHIVEYWGKVDRAVKAGLGLYDTDVYKKTTE